MSRVKQLSVQCPKLHIRHPYQSGEASPSSEHASGRVQLASYGRETTKFLAVLGGPLDGRRRRRLNVRALAGSRRVSRSAALRSSWRKLGRTIGRWRRSCTRPRRRLATFSRCSTTSRRVRCLDCARNVLFLSLYLRQHCRGLHCWNCTEVGISRDCTHEVPARETSAHEQWNMRKQADEHQNMRKDNGTKLKTIFH